MCQFLPSKLGQRWIAGSQGLPGAGPGYSKVPPPYVPAIQLPKLELVAPAATFSQSMIVLSAAVAETVTHEATPVPPVPAAPPVPAEEPAVPAVPPLPPPPQLAVASAATGNTIREKRAMVATVFTNMRPLQRSLT